jgi:hypothetical protein
MTARDNAHEAEPDATLQALISSALAAYLELTQGPEAPPGQRWATAARPLDPGASRPWRAGEVTWAEAERPV